MDSAIGQFLRGDYMPHGHCYMWQPHILWTHVLSDLLIATAYFSIPVAILMFMKKRKDIGYNSVFVLFSLFILFCGITHLFGIWTIWQGVYGYHGIAKAFTAGISIITAFYLYKLLPGLLKVPTPAEVEGMKTEIGASKQENLKLTSLLEKHQQTRWLIDTINLSLVLINESGQIVFRNKKFEQEFSTDNTTMDELLYDASSELQNTLSAQVQAIEVDVPRTFIGKVKTRAHISNAEITVTKKEYDEHFHLLVTIKDLKEIYALKDELVESNARFERALKATNDGIWEWNIHTGEQNWSEQMFDLVGADPSSTPTYKLWFDHIHPMFQDDVQEAVDQHLQQGERYEVEYLGLDNHGSYRWFLARGNSIPDEHGNPIIMAGSLRYIDEEKQAKRLLEERTEYLEALYKGSNHAIWVAKAVGSDFEYTLFNDTALKWTNTKKNQIISKKVSELTQFPEDFKQHVLEKYSECLTTKLPVEYIESFPFEGKPHWFQTSLYPIKNDETDFCHSILGTAVDITQQIEAQQAVEDNHQFLTNLLDNSVCGFYLFNYSTMQNERINKAYTDILGYSLEDLQSDKNFMAKFHPDDIQDVEHHIEQVAKSNLGDKHPLEYRFKHKDGHWVWCYSVDSIIEVDNDGKPQVMLGTFVDVSDKNELLRQLQQSNEYLEQFAFVASHDLQEPLRKITAFSESLQQRLTPLLAESPDAKYELTRLQQSAIRMSMMIEDLLKLSRINTNNLRLKSESLDVVLGSVFERLELRIQKSNAEITTANTNTIIYADIGLLEQLLQNLVGNALKFVKAGETPKVDITVTDLATSVEISIKDQGIGMKPESIKRIFDPFKRLHSREEFDGSGIGLAIVSQIVKAHKATIICNSEEGKGSEFVVSFPKEM
ncbi:MAG: PAS domain-containing protein [Gammaproteobacteria bacterium]|nr:PAS domain-containing protein [Gammaproteobacteria bacterium]